MIGYSVPILGKLFSFPYWEILLKIVMKVAGRKHLEEFTRLHGDVRSQIDAWLCEVEEAEWHTPQDLKARYAHVSFLADNRVIFNLKGNKYRLDTKVSFKNQVVLIVRAGTHAEYTSWKF